MQLRQSVLATMVVVVRSRPRVLLTLSRAFVRSGSGITTTVLLPERQRSCLHRGEGLASTWLASAVAVTTGEINDPDSDLLWLAALPSARGGSLLGRMPIPIGLKLGDSVDLTALGMLGLVIVTVPSVGIDTRAVAR